MCVSVLTDKGLTVLCRPVLLAIAASHSAVHMVVHIATNNLQAVQLKVA